MAGSDAIVSVGDFIAEYYFTTDDRSGSFLARTRELVERWKQEAEETPGFRSPLAAFTAERTHLLSEFIALAESDDLPAASIATADHLRRILGYTDEDGAPRAWRDEAEGALHRYATPGMDRSPLAIIDALACETADDLLAKDAQTLAGPVTLGAATRDEVTYTSASRLLSALIREEDAPDFMLVLAGRTVVLAAAETWAEGRYLALDLQTVADRNETRAGGEVQRALACISAEALAPDANGEVWWTETLAQSVGSAVGVSKDLRDGVRDSIEIIANEVIRRRGMQGLAPLPQSEAQELAVESLRYLYRILFLLFAEASPQLGVVPAGAPEYEAGYSIDRLRELTLVQIGPDSADGTHLYESIHLLCDLVERGHEGHRDGLTFESLRADLFKPDRTRLIQEVRLGNGAVQQVLKRLLLSKERKGTGRGFISYVALGINQLGSVYESLMSYTGSFATTNLLEVAPGGDPSKGSWVVPEEGFDESLRPHLVFSEDELGQRRERRYSRGEFVFRLSGRQRQQSASYYSPEVITRFTVSQALEELLDAETSADAVLHMSVCEPALGSGAFAIEAVRQLAEQYLARRQEELGERIDPDRYAEELQRVKAYIALHNVYGVDLNPTAVELAEVSLWLDTMARGLKAPWFGLRLRPGNSLIGARHAVYSRSQLGRSAPSWVGEAPGAIGLRDLVADAEEGELGRSVRGKVFHFLVPGEGWGAAGSDKEIKRLAPENAKKLRDWAKDSRKKLTARELDRLGKLSRRVEELWSLALRRIREAELQSRRAIPVWGAEVPEGGAITREVIEASLNRPGSAYQRLRLVMDAWCALWFWPVAADAQTPGAENSGAQTPGTPAADSAIAPPTRDEWIYAIEKLLGSEAFQSKRSLKQQTDFGQGRLGAATDEWAALDEAEAMFTLDGAEGDVDAFVAKTPWLQQVRAIAREQRFFHWELDFAAVFANGGFDLQVGNPPWVRPDVDLDGILSDIDPWWAVAKSGTAAQQREREQQTLARREDRQLVLNAVGSTSSTRDYLSSGATFPEVGGRIDLYRIFMAQVWAHGKPTGVEALIHPPTHFTDAKGQRLRAATYRHLRRHWGFINEKQLFHEVHHLVQYSVNVYGNERTPSFLNAVSLYLPATVERSLVHDGSGPEPGFKDDDGNWDLRPHSHRIQRVDHDVLRVWHELMEGGNAEVPVAASRMVFSVNQASANVLARLASVPRIGDMRPEFSTGWNETNAFKDGFFERKWGRPNSWRDVILQGPYFHVATPFVANRNESMKSNLDYSDVDLETLPADALPITEYKPIYRERPDGTPDTSRYDAAYGSWKLTTTDAANLEQSAGSDVDSRDPANPAATSGAGDADSGTQTQSANTGVTGSSKLVPVRSQYRIMWRRMAATTGERTLIPAVFPPGTAHVHPVHSDAFPTQSLHSLALAAAAESSLLDDFMIRSTVTSDIHQSAVDRLPRIPADHPLAPAALLRILRLNCLPEAYADLWHACWDESFRSDVWTGGRDRPNRPALGDVGPEWAPDTPLRMDEDRRRALVEIDAIVAIVTGITADELATIYRTQFGVLNAYDRGEGKRAYIYDADGRQIPSSLRTLWNKAGRPAHGLSPSDRTYTNDSGRTITAPEPFRILDREADLRAAYAAFERRLGGDI